jgi:hypothetical protein
MRTTTDSVPDVVSRGDGSAALTIFEALAGSGVPDLEIPKDLTGSEWGPEEVMSFGKAIIAAPALHHSPLLNEYFPSPASSRPAVSRLAIAAQRLAEYQITAPLQQPPMCRVCLMSGLNGNPIQHLPSCSVGEVFSALADCGLSTRGGRR